MGGMGVVYRGTDETLIRTVAIKTLKNLKTSEQQSSQFFAEARRLAKLSHPNVVQIYDVGKIGQRPYFVMEFLEGMTLASCLSRGPLNFATSLRILQQLLDGLHAVHQLGIVHRDIKPGNVILSHDLQQCQLLDFGLADEASKPSATTTGVSGTFGYLPPERLRGLPGDYRADFFSLGCVAYEMFSGVRLHEMTHARGENRLSLTVIDESEQWLNVPKDCREIVLRMLSAEPEERLCDYNEICSVLETHRQSSRSSTTDHL